MASVSPRRLRFATKPRVPESPSSTSLSSSASEQTSRTERDSDDSESDDEEGIFFGSHQPEEAEVLARISELYPAASPVVSRRTSRSHWVRKRDSREFLRRKTLLVEAQSQDGATSPVAEKGKGKEKVWPGGFHEVREAPRSAAEDSDESPQRLALAPDLSDTPTKSTRQSVAHSELTLQFGSLGVSTSSHRAVSSSEESEEAEEEIEGCSDLGSDDGGSDKENVEVPYTGPEEEEEDVGPVKESTISVGFDRQTEEEGDFELDMGGLKLSDFGDPEIDAFGAPLGPSRGLLDFATPAPANQAAGIFDAPDSHESSAVSEICFLEESEDTVEEAATPCALDQVERETTDVESPIPVARAGPVIIPLLSHHLASPIRADPGSPFRSLSTLAEAPPTFDTERDIRVRVGGLSPDKPMATPKAIHLHPLGHSTPSAPAVVLPGVEKAQKTLKSSVANGIPASVDRPRVVSTAKEKAAALVVRSALDAAVSRPNLMGPPQRTVSSSSSASSTSAASSRSNSSKTVTARPPVPAKAPQGFAKPLNGLPVRTFSRTVSEPIAALGARPAIPSRQANPVGPAKAGTAQPPARTIPRPMPKPTAKPPTLATRPPLQSRSLLIHPPRTAAPAQNVVAKPNRPALAFSAKAAPTPVAAPVEVPVKSLKRPFAMTQPAIARPAMAVGASVGPGGSSRPALGMPQRLVQDSSGVHFSMGVASESYRPAMSSSYRSPGRAGYRRVDGTPSRMGPGFGTPSRAMGTPSRSTPVRRPPIYLFTSITSASIAPASSATPSHDVAAVETSATAGPPASATRNATDALEVEAALGVPLGAPRGSSEDHEEVSFALPKASTSPSPSPTKAATTSKDKFVRSIPDEDDEQGSGTQSTGRPKRAPKPRQVAQPSAMKGKLAYSIVPSMSEKQLRETTHANTQKNQVYLCAIDRQIVRKTGPRPPSPTSKIRTVLDRDEEEKRKGRGDRAKRRAGDSLPEDERPVMEKVIMAKGPGEEDEYVTPARHLKKLKLAHLPFLGGGAAAEEKNVKWDKGVIVIRDNGERLEKLDGERPRARSAIRGDRVPLDKYGNLIATNRPQEKLKVQKVTVTAVFYDGEEPVPPPPAPSEATRSKKK